MDLAMRDVPESPSLFSPRQTEFMAVPFGRTAAGDLELSMQNPRRSISGLATLSVIDPRSPHQKNETGEIMRSIDEIL